LQGLEAVERVERFSGREHIGVERRDSVAERGIGDAVDGFVSDRAVVGRLRADRGGRGEEIDLRLARDPRDRLRASP